MASKAYYKTNDAAVMSALREHYAEGDKIIKSGIEFAKMFEGAQFFFLNDIHGISAAGLKFKPALRDPLWTQPHKRNGMQRPKASGTGLTKEQRIGLAALRTKWEEGWPKGKADFAPTLELIGVKWSDLIFAGFGMFEHEGFLYVTTSATLAPCMVEILGSEYIAAKTAYDAKKGDNDE